MLIHIVKTGETVDKIADSYRILKSDLVSNNLHITDFSHLKSGMKLKIPMLSKDNIETLEETEAFIDDYYPTFENFLNNQEKYFEEIEEPVVVEHVDVIEDKTIIEEKEINNKPSNNNIYYNRNNYYSGNVIPNINQKFIRKI